MISLAEKEPGDYAAERRLYAALLLVCCIQVEESPQTPLFVTLTEFVLPELSTLLTALVFFLFFFQKKIHELK